MFSKEETMKIYVLLKDCFRSWSIKFGNKKNNMLLFATLVMTMSLFICLGLYSYNKHRIFTHEEIIRESETRLGTWKTDFVFYTIENSINALSIEDLKKVVIGIKLNGEYDHPDLRAATAALASNSIVEKLINKYEYELIDKDTIEEEIGEVFSQHLFMFELIAKMTEEKSIYLIVKALEEENPDLKKELDARALNLMVLSENCLILLDKHKRKRKAV